MSSKDCLEKLDIGDDFESFFDNAKDILIIIALGGWKFYDLEGTYRTLMIYNDKTRLLTGSLKARSANRVILRGLYEAVLTIKKPTPVYLVCATQLGLRNESGRNRDICREIRDVLQEKECNAFVVEIFGGVDRLYSYVEKKLGNKEKVTVKQLFPKRVIDENFCDFFDKLEDVLVIISLGSCDAARRKGSYSTLMLYNDKVSLLENSVDTSSSNVCILMGMLDAVSKIKKPAKVYLVSGTPLGFNSRGSANRELCEKIYNELLIKNCDAEIIEIFNKSEELRNYVKSKAKKG